MPRYQCQDTVERLHGAVLHLDRRDRAGRRHRRDQQAWGRSPEATPLSLAVVKYSEALYHWIGGIGDCGIRAAAEGLEISATHGIHMVDHHLIARKLFGALNCGDLKLSGDFFDRLESVTDGSMQLHMIKYQYHYLPAWHSLLKADFAKAHQQALTSLKVTDEAGGSAFHRAFSNITAAQALVCQGSFDKAKKHIAAVLTVGQELQSGIIEFNGLLLQAQGLIGDRHDDSSFKRGLTCLRKALMLGKEQGYQNTVVWYGPSIQALCSIALHLWHRDRLRPDTDHPQGTWCRRTALPYRELALAGTDIHPRRIQASGQ